MRQQFFLIFNRISDTWRLIFENLRNFEKIHQGRSYTKRKYIRQKRFCYIKIFKILQPYLKLLSRLYSDFILLMSQKSSKF